MRPRSFFITPVLGVAQLIAVSWFPASLSPDFLPYVCLLWCLTFVLEALLKYLLSLAVFIFKHGASPAGPLSCVIGHGAFLLLFL